MNAILRRCRCFLAVAAPALVAVLLAGCATGIDWNTRVGSYTYDQAVLELGPPDKQARLSDGTTVADWLAYRGGTSRVFAGGGYGYWHPHHPHFYGGPTIVVDDYATYESYLRLVFAPDGSLQSFKKYTR